VEKWLSGYPETDREELVSKDQSGHDQDASAHGEQPGQEAVEHTDDDDRAEWRWVARAGACVGKG